MEDKNKDTKLLTKRQAKKRVILIVLVCALIWLLGFFFGFVLNVAYKTPNTNASKLTDTNEIAKNDILVDSDTFSVNYFNLGESSIDDYTETMHISPDNYNDNRASNNFDNIDLPLNILNIYNNIIYIQGRNDASNIYDDYYLLTCSYSINELDFDNITSWVLSYNILSFTSEDFSNFYIGVMYFDNNWNAIESIDELNFDNVSDNLVINTSINNLYYIELYFYIYEIPYADYIITLNFTEEYQTNINDKAIVSVEDYNNIQNYNTLQSQYNTLQEQYNQLEQQYNSLLNSNQSVIDSNNIDYTNSYIKINNVNYTFNSSHLNNANYTLTLNNNNTGYTSADYYGLDFSNLISSFYNQSYEEYTIYLKFTNQISYTRAFGIYTSQSDVSYEFYDSQNNLLSLDYARGENYYQWDLTGYNRDLDHIIITLDDVSTSDDTYCNIFMALSGYNSGYAFGYDNGYYDGKEKGYINGINDEKNNIDTSSASYQNGYSIGYTEGTNSTNVLAGMIWAVADVPFITFKNIFGFDILGINLANFILGTITLLLVIYLIKKLL